jgi:hypothetical protein
MFSLFSQLDSSGIPLDAFSARALSPEEITRYQMQNLQACQQVKPDLAYIRGMAQYSPPKPPVIERDDRFGYCYTAG